ncbi:hypothetical protein V8C86DRAFT_2650145 [Haematococcus lacustris]
MGLGALPGAIPPSQALDPVLTQDPGQLVGGRQGREQQAGQPGQLAWTGWMGALHLMAAGWLAWLGGAWWVLVRLGCGLMALG